MFVSAVAAALAHGASDAVPSAEPVNRDRGRSTVAAGDEYVVWNRYDRADRAYRIVVRAGTAAPADAAVASRAIPFDLDVGRDGHGRAIATYSRCKREPPRSSGDALSGATSLPPYNLGRGCGIRQLDLATGVERTVARTGSDRSRVVPSRWGKRLAFAEIRAGARRPKVYVLDLTTGKRRAVAGIPASDIRYGKQGVEGAFRIDLVEDELALGSARYSSKCLSEDENLRDARQLVTDVLLVPLRRSRARRIASACQHAVPAVALVGASLTGSPGELIYGRVREGAAAYEVETTYTRVSPDGAKSVVGRSAWSSFGLAADDGRLFVAEAQGAETAIQSFALP